jgi:hypothetical protein
VAVSDRFDYLDEEERQWLRAVRRRSAARRARLLAAVVLVVVLGLTLLASGRSREFRRPAPVPAGPTAEQRALEDGQRALAAWGRFAVTNDLRQLRGHFWANGPQYQDLLRLSRLRSYQRPLGPPPYRFVLTRARVLAPSLDQRILQGRVQVSRPGERMQSYRWNVWMRRDSTSRGRWRLWTVEETARAPARSPRDPVVAAAGDVAPPGTGWGHRATSDRVLAIDPTVVLALGDNQYPSGSLSDFRRYYGSTWGRFKTRTRPSPGNHEYETAGAAGYFAYFGKLAKSSGRSYYSFDLGGWHLISLDSNIDLRAGSRQERWLRADLAATTKRCILAYWHHPRFTSGAHQGDNRWVGPFWNALYTARADVVLGGHEHNYERFARQNPTGRASPQGIRQFVVGTGGADLLGFAAPKPNSQVRRSTTWGVLVLVLHPRSYRWRFVSEDGDVVDRGGPVACH